MEQKQTREKMDPKMYNSLSLAFLGDAVYGMMVRKHLLKHGDLPAKRLHAKAISYVSASSQYKITSIFPEILTEEEYEVFKRGRNAVAGHQPKHGTLQEYHAATGLEAVFGYLQLKEDTERIEELFAKIAEYVEERK